MAQLKCGFCQGASFALSTEQPAGSRYPIAVVRCVTCDVPIGVLQQEDPNQTIRDVAQLLTDRLRRVEDRLHQEIADLRSRLQ